MNPRKSIFNVCKELISNCLPVVENLSPEINKDFDALKQAALLFGTAVNTEEDRDEEASFDVALYYQHEKERAQLKKSVEEHEKKFEDHAKTLDEIERQLNEIHQQIMENQGEISIEHLKKLVKGHFLHLDYDDEIKRLRVAIAAQSCCVRIFFPCFSSKEVREATQRLARLEAARQKFESEQFIDVYHAAKYALEERRRNLKEKRAAVIAEPIPDVDTKAQDALLTIKRQISMEERVICHSLTKQQMIYLLAMYEALLKIQSRLGVQDASIFNRSPLLNPDLERFKQAFAAKVPVIKRQFADFWYLHRENKAGLFHEKFKQLGGSDQERLLETPDLFAQLINYKPGSIIKGSPSTQPHDNKSIYNTSINSSVRL